MGVQMIEFFPVRHDRAACAEYVSLFEKCFPTAKKYSPDYLDWLYRCNPDGQVVGYDARDGDRLAAHYACIPARARIGSQEVKVLLSLNTATHPDYQGKGLFTQLAERTYAAGAALGYDCVYGVANANSTPGFIRKLKFQLVGPLQAMAGVGSLGIAFTELNALQFRRSWSPQALKWRCASPVNPVVVRKRLDHTTFLAPALLGGTCMAAAEIGGEVSVSTASVDMKCGFASPLRLFIGLIPPAAQRRALYVDIPQMFRPSPLNLIYRSLSGRVESIDLDTVFFNFLDFDAY
jgi:GNAT superfamily N-acetyltransferase